MLKVNTNKTMSEYIFIVIHWAKSSYKTGGSRLLLRSWACHGRCYKTSAREECPKCVTVRFYHEGNCYTSQSGPISLLKNIYMEIWFSEWKTVWCVTVFADVWQVNWITGCFTIVETKRQLLKPLPMTLFIFHFPVCHREIVNLSIY